jgi:hypothetical protein
LIKTLADATGATTEYIYDYEVRPGGTGVVVELRHPQITRPDGSVHRGIEQFTYNAFRRV